VSPFLWTWAAFIALTSLTLLALLTIRYPVRLVPFWVALIILTPRALGGYA
jgi:hypothetical protein